MMKYLVMETALAYAVVLSEDGRFLTVANFGYEVGDYVTDVFEMQSMDEENLTANDISAPEISLEQHETPKKQTAKPKLKLYRSFIAAAACFAVVVGYLLTSPSAIYASAILKINPEVKVDINRKEVVIGIEGLNEDGQKLIADYQYAQKHLDTVMNELVDLAVEMDYLHEGGKVSISIDGKNSNWVTSEKERLNTEISNYVTEKITITLDVHAKGETDYSDYGDSDYLPDGITIPVGEDTDYGKNSDGVTDFDGNDDDASDYGPDRDGVTDFDSDYIPPQSANPSATPQKSGSDYSDSSYGEGVTDYTPDAPAKTDSPYEADTPYSPAEVDKNDSPYQPSEADSPYEPEEKDDSPYKAPEKDYGKSDYDEDDD